MGGMIVSKWMQIGGLACALAGAACGEDEAQHGREPDAGGEPDTGTPDAGEPLESEDGLTISLTSGKVHGTLAGETRRFLGIPYAEPPIGELRWKPPVEIAAWEGTFEAGEFGKRCAQAASATLMSAGSMDEDCLTLNVWTPKQTAARDLPVMVWIHGGGNMTGSSSEPIPFLNSGVFYDGQSLAEHHGVVVVSFNYRLGAFGFFAHSALAAEGSSVGNQGLLDQQLVLRWVQANIVAFRGDPQNVTIFGESAGSLDVCFHMALPESQGLFHRAISQSGGCTTRHPPAAEAEASINAFAEALGCTGGDTLACLRGKSVAELLTPAPLENAPATPLPGGAQYQGTRARWSFTPVVDGEVLPDQPRALFDAGQIAQVPYILGSNTDEGTLFHAGSVPVMTEEEYLAALTRRFGDQAAAVAALYPTADFADKPNPTNAALARVSGDATLVCSTYDSAVRAAAAGLSVYTYNFDVPVPVGTDLGATHGAELGYVFGSTPTAQQEPGTLVTAAMQTYWSTFAKTGDPNDGRLLAWPTFSLEQDQRINFAPELSVLASFRAEECAYWRGIYDALFAAAN